MLFLAATTKADISRLYTSRFGNGNPSGFAFRSMDPITHLRESHV